MAARPDQVLFLDPAPNLPSFRELVSTYFGLSYMARKRVQHIYLVGGGWGTTLMARLFSVSILSPKTAQNGKLVACRSLVDLAAELGLDTFRKLEIPLEVYETDARRSNSRAVPPELDSLSASITIAEDPEAGQLLPLVRDCLSILAEQGPTSPGIFRRPPSATSVAHIAAAYHRGHPVRLDFAPDGPYLAASLLKQHLAVWPEPVFSRRIAELARQCPFEDVAAADYVRGHLVPLLAPSGRQLLSAFLPVLARISANSDENLMTSANLAMCTCPALLGGVGASLEEVEMCRVPGMQVGSMRGLQAAAEDEAKPKENSLGGVLRLMVDRHAEIFPDDAASS
ncbi:hypothetical protein JCM8202v2_006221 [Rhodotorula sphaerocarpa]